MSVVGVDPGICLFNANIKVTVEGMNLKIEITSECPHVKKYAEAIANINLTECVQTPSPILTAAYNRLAHPACPMPVAVIKAIEVAFGLALPKDVHLTIQKASND